MGEPKLEKDFWSFLIQGTSTRGATAVVTGWFIACHITVYSDDDEVIDRPSDRTLEFEYLTPMGSPVTIDLTKFMPPKTRLHDISPLSVHEALEHMLRKPFAPVPKDHLNIPLHRMPPSRRKKIVAAKEAQRDHLPTRRKE